MPKLQQPVRVCQFGQLSVRWGLGWVCLLGLWLTGCNPQQTTSPSITLVPLLPTRTAEVSYPVLLEATAAMAYPAPGTLSPTLTSSITPRPSPTAPSPLFLSPTAYPTPAVTNLAPGELAPRLTSSLSIQTAAKLSHLTGWPNGWRDDCGAYVWLDEQHLLLQPVTSGYDEEAPVSYGWPVVINLANGQTWLPVSSGPTMSCRRAIWSEPFKKLLGFEEGETRLYDLDGNVIRRFTGGGAEGLLSPSGRRLVTGSLLLDLQTDAVQQTGVSVPGNWFGLPAWAPDETRIFKCCFGYANFETGQYITFTLGLENVGHGCSPRGCISSTWIDAQRVMVADNFGGPGVPMVSQPIIDPEAQTYLNPWPETDLLDCPGELQLLPNGQYSLVACRNQVYWKNLQTLATYSATAPVKLAGWTPDSQFLLLARDYAENTRIGKYFLQPVAGGAEFPLSAQPINAPVWKDSVAFFLTEPADALVRFDPRRPLSQTLPLPQTVSGSMFWSSADDYVALIDQTYRSLTVLTAADGTVKQITLTQPITATAYPSSTGWGFLGADRQSFTLVEAATGSMRLVELAQPVGSAIVWQSGDRLNWVSADGCTLVRLDLITGAMGQTTFPAPLYQVFPQPDHPGALVQAIEGSVWWVPDLAVGRAEKIEIAAPAVRQVKWSPAGTQVAFISVAEIYIFSVAPG